MQKCTFLFSLKFLNLKKKPRKTKKNKYNLKFYEDSYLQF